jgi:glycosyltransferase involved in cell wall biosynthesis
MLTVIIPCFNEETNVFLILDSLDKILINNKITSQVLIVDDKSTDSTANNIKQWIINNRKNNYYLIYNNTNKKGYGAAIKCGLAKAEGNFITFVSADLVDPINMLPLMLDMLNQGADMVQCTRYSKKEDKKTIPFWFRFFQFFYREFTKVSLGLLISDSTYAFKMIKKEKILKMKLTSNRFSISPEIMFKSVLMGLNVKFLPGSQGIRINGISKFSFKKEFFGFGYCLIMAFLHRKKINNWF